MNYFNIIKSALYYDVGSLEPVADLVDGYVHGKFIFQFPLYDKQSLNIYLYDDRYDLYADFDNATLLVYEQGEWIERGSAWERELNSYMNSLQSLIEQSKERLEQERLKEEWEKERLYDMLVARFALLFGSDFVKGYSDLNMIDDSRSIDVDYSIDELTEVWDFLNFLYGIEVIDVPDQ